MWNAAAPEVIATSCSEGRSSSDTRSPRSARTTSKVSRAGSTASPGRSTSASTGIRRPTSRSVARSSVVSPSAFSWTPDSACTALWVDATRATDCSWACSASRATEIFMVRSPDQLDHSVKAVAGALRCAQLGRFAAGCGRSEEHTSELQSPDHLVCRLLLEKKKKKKYSVLVSKKKKIKQCITL